MNRLRARYRSFVAPLVVASLFTANSFGADDSPPVIDLWYGDEQRAPGAEVAQSWFNVLGRASDPDSDVVALRFKLYHGESDEPMLAGFLNIGPHPVRVPINVPPGPRRLYDTGDFNIDIPKSALAAGANRVEITAFNGAGLVEQRELSIDYGDGDSVSSPLAIQWSEVDRIDAVGQVVDGLWQLAEDGVSVVEPGYDRVIALGSTNWRDLDASLSFRLDSVEEGSRLPASGPNELGSMCVVTRWVGHTDMPRRCDQPKCGWLPAGGTLCAVVDNDRNLYFRFDVPGESVQGVRTQSVPYRDGVSYNVRVLVEGGEGASSIYRAKVWPQGASEPAPWLMIVEAKDEDISAGALALRAHHLGVTVGDIMVKAPGE